MSDQLAVRTSRLQNAGNGLFALQSFGAGDVVCVYHGDILTTREALQVEDKSYLMRLGKGVYIDARDHPDVIARYINDCRSKGVHNVAFEKDPIKKRAIVRAIRPIAPNEELYVNYGTWYWLAYNMTHKENPIK
ncbi:hypothetical protein THRCLA_20233 [Thraustotheca clavata]|uniref:SET domain-containing protein n=1 Tax=Thraustotheca clavata TaxID=74557 RepID=A0A1W0A9R2_9STRA|nr:hypothetical protein THRCLA_20233 [Thraustotheca clavata]